MIQYELLDIEYHRMILFDLPFKIRVNPRCAIAGKALEKWETLHIICDDCLRQDHSRVRRQDISSNSEVYYIKRWFPSLKSLRCALCDRKLTSEIANTVSELSLAKHPDESHNFGFNIECLESPCLYCGTVRVRIQEREGFHFRYYRIGERNPIDLPFSCSREFFDHSSQTSCDHDLQTIFSSEPEGARTVDGMNFMLETGLPQMMGMGSQDVAYAYFGWTTQWCWKCGARYRTQVGG